jgi:hypothetical protein
MPCRAANSSSNARIRRTSFFSSSCSTCSNASSSTMSRLAKCAVIRGMTSSTMVEISNAARARPAQVVGEMSPYPTVEAVTTAHQTASAALRCSTWP